ncbi:pyridoxal phosphate-dependent decarboxylase family protein [Kribbella sp. NPDC051587]|uniref:pyridoxal phosphate-dependent decarboxylase family protein n=1 Tax=Kribbella sp. NPDC051587 TaxID=3364119 RepID=UPI0037B3609E
MTATSADPRQLSLTTHLLNEQNAQRYRELVGAAVEVVAARIGTNDRPFTGTTPQQLAKEIDAIDLDAPLGDTSAALDELGEVYLRDAVYFDHPRYLAHLNCPIVIPALVGETVLSAINSSMDTWDQSAGGTLIERRLVDWTAARIGFGPSADGVFTSGGTQSNLQAMLLARQHVQEETGAELSRLRILASSCGHFSVTKAATMLGLGADAVIEVACDADKRMSPVALQEAIDGCRARGEVVMAVVATAGTTDFGSIDPLPRIGLICAEAGVWMHVDAAYGCGLLVSRRRHLLAGIEAADSVTVDYHKSFFQPVSASALIVREADVLRHVTYHADYLNPAHTRAEQIPNQVDKSIQTTRRFDALKLWLTLRTMGADAIGQLFDEVIDRAADAWTLLDADRRYEVLVRPRLSTLVFRYLPAAGGNTDAEIDLANRHARKALAASGEAVVAGTVVDGRHYLKFTLLNPATTLDDIADVLDLIAGHARDYLGENLVPAAC